MMRMMMIIPYHLYLYDIFDKTINIQYGQLIKAFT